MRLNLGCGNRKAPDWVNVDKVAACNPDQVVDLEQRPWPWADDSVDEVMFSHVLEHLGASSEVYLGIFQELYRVCRDGAKVTVVVPHPRHNHFLSDPTHVRPITHEGLSLFSQAVNRQTIAQGFANTPLGVYLGIDFETRTVNIVLDEPWHGRFERRELSEADVRDAIRSYNNVVKETQIVLEAIKPAGRLARDEADGQAAR
jgi:predicted SAM-dependent methyltransferase